MQEESCISFRLFFPSPKLLRISPFRTMTVYASRLERGLRVREPPTLFPQVGQGPYVLSAGSCPSSTSGSVLEHHFFSPIEAGIPLSEVSNLHKLVDSRKQAESKPSNNQLNNLLLDRRLRIVTIKRSQANPALVLNCTDD